MKQEKFWMEHSFDSQAIISNLTRLEKSST